MPTAPTGRNLLFLNLTTNPAETSLLASGLTKANYQVEASLRRLHPKENSGKARVRATFWIAAKDGT